MNRKFWLILLAALGIAGGHLAFVASNAESGWSTLITQWQDVLLERFGFGHVSVDNMEPPEQAEFWMAEIDRLEQPISDSASMQMGAAWVLDSAGIGFLSNHWEDSGFGTTIPAIALQLDEDAVKAANEKFRQRCLDQCLLFAKKATETEPTDVRWWRMRALLLFDGDIFLSDRDFESRCDDWLDILDNCAQHDPDNALYDYLAAFQLWKQAATYDWPGSSELPTDFDGTFEGSFESSEFEGFYEGSEEFGETPEEFDRSEDDDSAEEDNNAEETEELDDLWILTINDEKQYAAGTKRFLTAQTKDFLAIGEAGLPALANFLEQSGLRQADQAKVTTSRLVIFRQSSLFLGLWRWQGVRGDHARQQNDPDGEKKILLQNLRLFDQAIILDETSALSVLTTFAMLRVATFEGLEKFLEIHPVLVTEGEIDSIRQREKMHRIETETLQLALQEMDSAPEQISAAYMLTLIFLEVACRSTAYLWLLAACFLMIAKAWVRTPQETVSLGYVRHVLAWLLGYGATFLLFGAFPAELIDFENQALIANAALYGLAGYAVVIAGRSMYRRKLRFRLSTLFVVTTAVALLAFLWPLIDMILWSLISTPADLLPQAIDYYGVGAELFCAGLNTKSDSFFGAIMQWHFHEGGNISLVLSLSIALIWYMRLCSKQAREGFFSHWAQLKSRWSPLLRFAGWTAAVAGACWLFAYFCIVPSGVRLAEADFHYKIDYCRDPQAHYTKIREAQTKIKSSAEKMKLIHEQIEFEFSDEGTGNGD